MGRIRFFAGLLLVGLCLAAWGCQTTARYDYAEIKRRHEAPRPEFAERLAAPERLMELPARPLTLKRAVAMSLANNPDVSLAVARILQAEAAVSQARAAFMPMVSFYSEANRGDAPSAYLFKKIDQRQLPPQVNFNNPGWFSNFEAGLQARWNVFNGFRDSLAHQMALSGVDMAQWGRVEAENALASAVIEAYYNTLAAKEYAGIAAESVETVRRQLDVVRVRYEAGSALKSDLLSLEVRLAQATEERVRAENAHSLGLAGLANLLGLSPDTDLALAGEQDLELELPVNYLAGVELALTMRPELYRAREAVRQAAMEVDHARGAYLPRVDLQGKWWAADDGLGLDLGRDNVSAGVLLNWDVFTGGMRPAAVDRARAGLDEMLAADRKAVQGVLLDLKSAYLRLEEARVRLEVARASVAQAEESLRLVRKQYEGGSATITRYLDAELAYSQARMREATARYDRETARAAAGRALGFCGRCARKAVSEYE